MDTFFEQIVKMKLTGKAIAIIAAIFLVDAVILFFMFAYAPPTVMSLMFVIVVGLFYGSYKIIQQISIEYEYIFTNGDLDVDKIIGKSSRKRMVSVKCSQAEKYGDYKNGMVAPGSVKKTYFFCNADDENQKYMIINHKDEGMVMLVFAPDERLQGAIEKYIPRLAM